jgi:hypothetical protein
VRPLVLAALLALPASLAHAKPPVEDDGPPPPKPPFTVETVQVPAGDGVALAGTYGAAGGKAGSPAVVMLPMEGTSRRAFEPLFERFEEHRVPWLAIDHRSPTGKDPEANRGIAADAWAAVRWLVDAKGHDPSRIGLMAAGVATPAAVRCTVDHPGQIAAIVLLTPHFDYPGFDLTADAHAMPRGNMDVLIASATHDMDKPADKKGPRHLLYMVKYDRDAPPDTPLDERIARRRGVPPRWLPFDSHDKPAVGTAMFAVTDQVVMDAWFAAWWARKLGTYPNAILFDGRVDKENDFADRGWDAGVEVPGPQGFSARALRWGKRLVIGGEMPKETRAWRTRIRVSRGPHVSAGQLCQVQVDSGEQQVSRILQEGGRFPPIDTQYRRILGDELTTAKGEVIYENPAFEEEIRLPDLPGKEPYEVRVQFGVLLGSDAEATGTDPERPDTWPVVPDQDAPGAPPPPATPVKPGGKPGSK